MTCGNILHIAHTKTNAYSQGGSVIDSFYKAIDIDPFIYILQAFSKQVDGCMDTHTEIYIYRNCTYKYVCTGNMNYTVNSYTLIWALSLKRFLDTNDSQSKLPTQCRKKAERHFFAVIINFLYLFQSQTDTGT